MEHDVTVFESCRPSLLALAYRMLGDLGRAEDVVQDAWLRWERSETMVVAPAGYLVKTVTRLCLNELDSARARREEARSDRLPEPVALERTVLDRIDTLDRVSMAFLVLLQRLTPDERAALLLHEVFEFDHAAIAELLERSEPASRQLLKRARDHVANERRAIRVPDDVHRRLLRAFLAAAAAGDADAVARLLADDAVLIVDAGPKGGRFGRVRNLPGPLLGAAKVAAFVAAVTPQGAAGLETRECELNGQPAMLVLRDGQPRTAILLSVVDGRIRFVFMQADPARLGHVT
ncbi:MAG: sigma-70 family RNA polymerase sigma factor [Myxococcota bacterium]